MQNARGKFWGAWCTFWSTCGRKFLYLARKYLNIFVFASNQFAINIYPHDISICKNLYYPNNILFLTIKSKQLTAPLCLELGSYLAIFKLNSSHDALATLDINRIKIIFYTFGKHDFGAAVINHGIIMKKSCSEEEIRQKSYFQIRQNTIYYTNRVLLVIINGENTIFARF